MHKAISCLQPWAQLIVLGAKGFETRGFKTNYRGDLLIHASGKFHFSDLELCHQDKHFRKAIPDPHSLPVGAIVGRVTLVDCKRVEIVRGSLSPQELAFGDYSDGRWAWLLENPILFKNPIKAKGALSIWNYEGPIVYGSEITSGIMQGGARYETVPHIMATPRR